MVEAACDAVNLPSITLQWRFPESVSSLICVLLGARTVFYSPLYPSSLSNLSPDIINTCLLSAVHECMNDFFGVGILAPWLSADRGGPAQTTTSLFLDFLNSLRIILLL